MNEFIFLKIKIFKLKTLIVIIKIQNGSPKIPFQSNKHVLNGYFWIGKIVKTRVR